MNSPGPAVISAQAAIGRLSRRCNPGDYRHSRNETLWKVSLRVRSVRLDAGELDHLAPLLRFVGNELSKVGVRTCEHRTSQVGEALLHVGIGESGIDLLVELLDNLRGCGFGHDDPVPASCL